MNPIWGPHMYVHSVMRAFLEECRHGHSNNRSIGCGAGSTHCYPLYTPHQPLNQASASLTHSAGNLETERN